MSREVIQPYIPEELNTPELWDEHAEEAYARLAAMPLKEFWKGMPPVDRKFIGDGAAGYVDLRPADHEDTDVVVLGNPFANGWAPHMALRYKLLQDVLPRPARLIIFPSDTLATGDVQLSEPKRPIVAKGDFSPIAERQFRTLDKLGITHWSRYGYSQDAAVGACALALSAKHGYFEIGPSELAEAPNAVPRTTKQIRKDFTAGGISPLNRAVNDSAIPALSKAQHSRGALDVLPQLAGFARYGLGTMRKENKAIQEGFTKPHFWFDIGQALSHDEDLEIHVTQATDSKIMPTKTMANAAQLKEEIFPGRFDYLTIEGYGHELGDNIVAFALIGKLALTELSRPA
jgi:hypothetical protein